MTESSIIHLFYQQQRSNLLYVTNLYQNKLSPAVRDERNEDIYNVYTVHAHQDYRKINVKMVNIYVKNK
jgi:hypothetical protein